MKVDNIKRFMLQRYFGQIAYNEWNAYEDAIDYQDLDAKTQSRWEHVGLALYDSSIDLLQQYSFRSTEKDVDGEPLPFFIIADWLGHQKGL